MSIAERESQILRIKAASFVGRMTEALEERLREMVIGTVKTLLEGALEAELLTFLAEQPEPRSRRSGYFSRQTDTCYGRIADLRVPKLRSGNRQREWRVLRRYQRARPELVDRLAYLYVMGLSLRDLQEALYLWAGKVVSRSAVNTVTLRAQALLDGYRAAPVETTPPILIVDGVWVDIQYTLPEFKQDRAGHRRQRRQAQERVILAVLGVYADGTTALIHFEVAAVEEEAQWSALCAQLLKRGLDPKALRLIVSDGAQGLPASIRKHFPHTKHQRCITHKVRGMRRYLTYDALPTADPTASAAQLQQQRWHTLKTEAYAIYKTATPTAARAALADFKAKWHACEPRAVHAFAWAFESTLSFFDFDVHLHPLIRTTNALERLFREFRNKADEIGAFPNEDSCLTLFFLVVQREHAKHDRPFMAKT